MLPGAVPGSWQPITRDLATYREFSRQPSCVAKLKSFVKPADKLTMPTYFDRYECGEHEAVWADLLALGTRVHENAEHF